MDLKIGSDCNFQERSRPPGTDRSEPPEILQLSSTRPQLFKGAGGRPKKPLEGGKMRINIIIMIYHDNARVRDSLGLRFADYIMLLLFTSIIFYCFEALDSTRDCINTVSKMLTPEWLARGAGATCQRIHSVDDATGQVSYIWLYISMLRCAHIFCRISKGVVFFLRSQRSQVTQTESQSLPDVMIPVGQKSMGPMDSAGTLRKSSSSCSQTRPVCTTKDWYKWDNHEYYIDIYIHV